MTFNSFLKAPLKFLAYSISLSLGTLDAPEDAGKDTSLDDHYPLGLIDRLLDISIDIEDKSDGEFAPVGLQLWTAFQAYLLLMISIGIRGLIGPSVAILTIETFRIRGCQ